MNPIDEKTIDWPLSTEIVKRPSTPVTVPLVLPLMVTLTPGIGWLLLSKTIPLTGRFWAKRLPHNVNTTISVKSNREILSKLCFIMRFWDLSQQSYLWCITELLFD